jgi:tRNA modification GTPase
MVGSTNLELKAECIRLASDEVGRLTGRVDVEEWLGAIFNRFCIGK